MAHSQKYRDYNYLIQHLKHEDIHLYEALDIGNDNVKEIVKTIEDKLNANPPTTTVYHVFNFGLAQGADLVVAVEPTSYLTVEAPKGIKLFRWRIRANTAPTGANIIIDIKRNGSTIFPAGGANKIVLPAGSLRAKKENAFLSNPFVVNFDDELIPEVTQVGSTVKGFKIQIQLTGIVL